jgi:hypothetical protein
MPASVANDLGNLLIFGLQISREDGFVVGRAILFLKSRILSAVPQIFSLAAATDIPAGRFG